MSKKRNWVICPECSGEGRHSLAIDGQGLTQEDLDDWSFEELEDYREGRYDQTCSSCAGSGKVLEEAAEEAYRQRRRYGMSDAEIMLRDWEV